MVSNCYASNVAQDLIGSYVPSGSYFCYIDEKQINDVMNQYRLSKTDHEANNVLISNDCRLVVEEEEFFYPIKEHKDYISVRTSDTYYETEFWFTFLAIDGDGDIVPGFVGIDTD